MVTRKSAVVIDDHPLVAPGIATFLESHCGFDDVQVVTNSDYLWRHIDVTRPPQIFVLDFWMPDGASITLLYQLKLRCPATPILVVSADDDIAVQKKVQLTGAQGFINKQEATDVFVKAVKSLLNGESWFINTNPRKTFNYQTKELAITAAELGLTERQGEILAMIIKGLPNIVIAKNLQLSEQTVKEHVSGILSRLGVSNRIGAITKLRGKRLD